MDRTRYITLAERYFEAETTPEEERRLKAFLAGTDDPAFDEVKAVAGFFAAGKAVHGPRRRFPFLPVAVAAGVAVAAFVGFGLRRDRCYIRAYGEKTTDAAQVLAEMETTLASLFGAGEDVGDELSDLFQAAL